MNEIKITEKPEEGREHDTPEMKQLIIEFAEAKDKDDLIVKNFRKKQELSKHIWFARPEAERQDLINQGMGFEEVPDPPSKWVRAYRRGVRYRLFRAREGKEEFDRGLKKWMELQFMADMTWANFTFTWDVSYTDPLKVIDPMEWDGRMVFDPFSKKKICDPAAFTKQAM